ncbi:MAG: M23 family metallopeptidase, partial [Anaerolineaceae bacterium]|nr:M23 family metallopeptidase [Anaerolineaceae bacterium]
PNLVSPGQQLVIPPPEAGEPGGSYKIIPDSELVYGPSTVILDLPGFVQANGGYLIGYQEKVGDAWLTGPQILERVAHEYSVNPRILLTALEYQSGWVTKSKPAQETQDYPMRWFDPNYKGLYRQLAWTANNLNRGYYLWKINAVAAWNLADGSVVPPDPTINAGTAAVQHLFGLLYSRSEWEQATGEKGFYQTFFQFFGFPFDYTIDPLVTAGLSQPEMQLPFKTGETWSFTGGPHGGWGSGSAWAAIDFAPPGEGKGCAQSDDWVRAVADGKIIRSENGVVILDLDGDGYEQTGWTVLYLHMETRGRVAAGADVKAGDRIGHPSCEGGVSNGSHVHMARRYNGEWISADGNLPFNLDGWVSQGSGIEYDGKLIREGKTVESWEFFTPENQITR